MLTPAEACQDIFNAMELGKEYFEKFVNECVNDLLTNNEIELLVPIP